jgi:hypothetical protein
MFFILIIIFLSFGNAIDTTTTSSYVATFTYPNIPNNLVTFHLSCPESSINSLTCSCQINCKSDSKCLSAIKICKTLQDCAYVIIKKVNKKYIATLKRKSTPTEDFNFDISKYPTSLSKLTANDWSNYQQKSSEGYHGPKVRDLLKIAGHGISLTMKGLRRNNNFLCGSPSNSLLSTNITGFVHSGVSLVVNNKLSSVYLYNSLLNWNNSGLLSLVSEKIIILNNPEPIDLLIAMDFGLRAIQPKDITNSKTINNNAFSDGAEFYYALDIVNSQNILFLNTGQLVGNELTREDVASELIASIGLLDRGIDVVRMNSRKTLIHNGCNSFGDCNRENSKEISKKDTYQTWLSFYCRGNANKGVSDCLDIPEYR